MSENLSKYDAAIRDASIGAAPPSLFIKTEPRAVATHKHTVHLRFSKSWTDARRAPRKK